MLKAKALCNLPTPIVLPDLSKLSFKKGDIIEVNEENLLALKLLENFGYVKIEE